MTKGALCVLCGYQEKHQYEEECISYLRTLLTDAQSREAELEKALEWLCPECNIIYPRHALVGKGAIKKTPCGHLPMTKEMALERRLRDVESREASFLDLFNTELRENGPADVEQAKMSQDNRHLIRALVDYAKASERYQHRGVEKRAGDMVAEIRATTNQHWILKILDTYEQGQKNRTEKP